MTIRPIKDISLSKPVLEGAGVKLNRAFGFGNSDISDPFLLLDDFRNDNAEDYLKGFPWHPHRGIETITYILKGTVEHSDSLGNIGNLNSGDVQWMTAGSGILHQEMPKGNEKGEMHGFQLWSNLPSSLKMTTPNYQDIPSQEIKEIHDDDGSQIRIIVGNYRGYKGPVIQIAADPQFLDIFVPPNTFKTIPVSVDKNALAYIFEGSGKFDYASKPRGINIEKSIYGNEIKIKDLSGNKTLINFDKGDSIKLMSGEDGIRFLLISGKPIQEPVAWHGPIVMNNFDEIKSAMEELKNGTFIKN